MNWIAPALLALTLAAQATPSWQGPLDSAKTLMLAGRYADSIAAYETLLKAHPSLAQAHTGLAHALASAASEAKDPPGSARYRRAEASVLKAVDLATDATTRREALSGLLELFTLWQPSRRADGLAVFNNLAKQRPDDVVVHLGRARLWMDSTTIVRYVTEMRTVRAKFPNDSEVRWTLAMALRDQANLTAMDRTATPRPLLTEAIAEFDAALKMDPQSGMALTYKALTLRDLADLETDPKKVDALRAEFKVLFARGERILKEAAGP